MLLQRRYQDSLEVYWKSSQIKCTSSKSMRVKPTCSVSLIAWPKLWDSSSVMVSINFYFLLFHNDCCNLTQVVLVVLFPIWYSMPVRVLEYPSFCVLVETNLPSTPFRLLLKVTRLLIFWMKNETLWFVPHLSVKFKTWNNRQSLSDRFKSRE